MLDSIVEDIRTDNMEVVNDIDYIEHFDLNLKDFAVDKLWFFHLEG